MKWLMRYPKKRKDENSYYTRVVDNAITSATPSISGDSHVRSFGSLIDSAIRTSTASTTDADFDLSFHSLGLSGPEKETAEADPYTIIKVARDEDFAEQIGKELYFDLVDHDKVRSFRAQKQMSFCIFQVKVAKEFGVPVEFQRFWIWTKRGDYTYRPYRPLTLSERGQSVGQLSEASDYVPNLTELKLFLEVELGLDLRPISPPNKTKDDILLFFKLFDPDNEELCYVGRLFVKSTGRPTEILKQLNIMAGYDPDEELALYEEIGVEPTIMCEPIDKDVTFRASQLQDGDIVCFLKVPAQENVLYPDVPSYLEVMLKKEQEEKEHKKKEKAEAHLYTVIKVARDDDLKDQIGKEIYFDLVDHEKVRSFRVQKRKSFNDFKEDVAKEFDIPVQFQRFWLWAKRQNHMYRPNRPLTPMEEAQSVGQLREVSNKVHIAELKLFLEVELGPDLCPIAPPDKTKDDILLFFKLYDPEKELLRYVGRLFVKSTGKPSEILTTLNKMAGYGPDEDIVLYEEIKSEPNVMCEPVDKKVTFRVSQLGDGDIVCFQKVPAIDTEESLRYPDVPSYLEYVHNRQQQEDEEMLVPNTDLPENNHQPMEVTAQADAANTVESQPVEDPSSSRFTWRIDNFSRMNTKKLYSEVFVVGGYKWRVLIFPKGNNVDYLSMYLDVADAASLPYGWSRYAQFSLAVVNQIHSKYTVRKDTQHQFNARESDWGFTSFMPLGELYDPSRGYLLNDTLVVEAEVLVRRIVDYWTYDSKKETGYVGLKNQGTTCYMNSLLQTLYHIPHFRKAVYHMPTTENDMPSGSIPLALQSLFYKLQYSDTSVATKELTKSFGWDTYDSFMQHDVQELNRVLCEKLEDKMKGTVVEGTIQKLFEGHHMNYIECINVDYKSTRKESFYDLQLDVKGCPDVYASFDKYVEVECLEGDNKYHAEQYGLQDAKKGVLFIDFPPVLQLQLKRFEYDFMRDTMVKINDRYEFPLQLDLDRENGKYLSLDADRNVRNLYTLHSVLVHSGGVHGGHYYAFIRPTLSEQWYKFDDERVTKEDTKRALEEQYGGEEELPQTNPGFNNTPFKFTKYSNAYMLVYIREADKDKVICNVDEKDIAEHLRVRLKKEQEEKEHKKKEKAEAHLYTIIKVARDDDLKDQIGKEIYFDLVDHEKVRSFRVQKQMSFNDFKEDVAKEFDIPVQFQRFWLWAKRQNHTYRPNRPLTPMEEAQSVGQLREVSNKVHIAELKLFLEVELGPDLRPIAPPDKTKDDILLFFKLYDPEKELLRYVGRLFVKSTGKPSEILTTLNKMAGYDPDEDIVLYEEIKFEPNVMCEPIDKKVTFRASQLEDGDIVCFQKVPAIDTEESLRYPDVPSYLEYVHNRQVVHFRSLEKPKEDDFSLEMSRLYTYDDVVERVAQQLGVDDPSMIRLTPHNCYSQQPKPQSIKYRGVEHLSDMLVHYNQTSDILYYEVLDIPLPELQGLKTLKVAFHPATKDEVVIHTIRLPKQSTVGDVLDDLKTKVELSGPEAELRLLEVFYHKIYKVFPPHEKIENINDQYWTLRAEEIPEEEKNLSPHDRLIHVYHFTKDTAQNQMQIQNFGEPFFLVIREGETLAEIKVRIQKKLQVPDDEFVKWKFAFFSLGRPEYLQDSDIVSSRFQRRDVYGAWEQYLGLEHTDTAPKRSYAVNQNRHTFEKPVKIYN